MIRRVLERRQRHRRRPLIIRIAVAAGGFAVSAAGALLAIVLPEAGLPLLAVGLGLLSLEFDWAAQALAWTLATAAVAGGWLRGRRRAAWAAGVILFLLVAALVVWMTTLC